jgi:hypothetical protein
VATLRTHPQQTPLVDHQLIIHADAADLPREYCSATITQFLVRVLGEQLEPLLPGLAALQRDGVVSAAKVQIVERAIHTLSRPSLDPQTVQTAEQLLTDQAPILAPGGAAPVRPGGRGCRRPRRPRTGR